MGKNLNVYIIAIFLVFMLGCYNNKNINKDNNLNYSKKVKLEEVKNIKVEERKGEVELKWDIVNQDKIDKIIIIRKGAEGLTQKYILQPTERKYIISLEPLEKTSFYIKLQYKNGEVTPGEKVIATAKLGAVILNEKEFIDITSESVKFLFKTNVGANVKFYLGEEINNLKLVYEEKNYNFKNGIKISGLIPERKYFYKIEAEFENEKVETPVIELKKEKTEDLNIKAEWARESIFYEVFIRSFSDSNGDGIGDFRGLADKMDYLKNLGVDALWLMPCFKSNSYHGYDIVDYYNVEEDYGTMADFEYMIAKAKENNIRIILDLVINHTSRYNLLFEKSLNNESGYENYYVWATPFDNREEPGPWGQNVWHNRNGRYYYADFYAGMPDLNFRNKNVREEMKKVAEFWLNKGVDGFRLDAARHIDDFDEEVTLSWWKEFNYFVKSKNREAFLVGEAWDPDPNKVAPYVKVLDSSFNFGFSDMLIEFTRKGTPDIFDFLKKTREIYYSADNNFIDCTFIRNHDMSRTASEFRSIDKQKILFTLLFTLPGTPFIYYGEEIGQKGMKPDENIREPMDWYKEMDGVGMTKWEKSYYNKPNDSISVEEQINDENSLYNYVKKLIKIRKKYKRIFNVFPEKINYTGIYGYIYKFDEYNIEVIYNFTNETQEYKIAKENIENLLTEKKIDSNIILKPNEVLILKY